MVRSATPKSTCEPMWRLRRLRHAVDDSETGIVGLLPPLTLGDFGARRHAFGIGNRRGAKHAARIVLKLELVDGNAVDAGDARGDDGDGFELALHAGLLCKQRLHAGELFGRDVDEEDVGRVGGDLVVHLAHDSVLHEEDGKDKHDARSERGEDGRGLIAGAVEVGESVPQCRGQMQPGLVEKRAQRAQGEGGKPEDDEKHRTEAGGEPLADGPGIGKRGGDAGEAGDDEGDGEPLELALAEFRPPEAVGYDSDTEGNVDGERDEGPAVMVMAQAGDPEAERCEADKEDEL